MWENWVLLWKSVGSSEILPSSVSLPFVSPGETETAPLPEVEVDRWVLDYDRSTMDYDRSNNVRHPRAFGAIEPIQIRMLTRLEDPEHTQLFWVPALSWNHFLMVGCLVPPFTTRHCPGRM